MLTGNSIEGRCPINRGYLNRDEAQYKCDLAIRKKLEIDCDVEKNNLVISKKFLTKPKEQAKMVGLKDFILTGKYSNSSGGDRDFILKEFAYTSTKEFPDTLSKTVEVGNEICDVLGKILSKPVSGYSY